MYTLTQYNDKLYWFSFKKNTTDKFHQLYSEKKNELTALVIYNVCILEYQLCIQICMKYMYSY